MNLLLTVTILSMTVMCDIYGFRIGEYAFKLYGNGPDNGDYEIAQEVCLESGGEVFEIAKVDEKVWHELSDMMPFDARITNAGFSYMLEKKSHHIYPISEDKDCPFMCQLPNGS